MATASLVPAHVPAELVHPIGLTEGPEFLAAPHAFMAGLHDRLPPVFFSTSEHASNAWLLIKHADCFHVLRNPDLFTTAGATPFPRDPANYFPMIPLESDPPHHRRYRSVLDTRFSPAAIAALEPRLRALANMLIDEFIDDGACEFTTGFGRPLPVSIFLDLMGLPQAMRDTFVRWAMGLLHSQSREIAGRSMMEACAYLQEVVAEKRANPGDDAISDIVHAEPGGQPLTGAEMFGFTFFLFIAGLDTVFATLNNIWLWLAQNPDRRREIAAQPENVGRVVEELLRVFGVTFAGRTLTRDTELRGVAMKAGDKVTCLLPAANCDPEVFDDPRAVRFDRPRKPILSFAGGVHSCMGAHLARLELKVCLEEWLRRIPDFSIRPGTDIEYWPGGVVGPKSVPLVW